MSVDSRPFEPALMRAVAVREAHPVVLCQLTVSAGFAWDMNSVRHYVG